MIITRQISLPKLIRFTWPRLLILLAFTLLACFIMDRIASDVLKTLSYAAGFLGTALAFLIGFRNNAAYGRWWEGHRIWSALKYETRHFALLVQGLVGGEEATSAQRQQLIYRQIAFAWRLNHFLRHKTHDENEKALLSASDIMAVESRQNPPLAILDLQIHTLKQLADAGHLDSIRLVRLSESLHAINQVLGSCERLKKTPFPMQYTWFMNYTLFIFLLILPLSLAGHLGYLSIPFGLLIGYAFVMLEYVGRHIENPFENQVNDVPMDYIARNIDIDLRQMLQETQLPEPVKPVGKGYLY